MNNMKNYSTGSAVINAMDDRPDDGIGNQSLYINLINEINNNEFKSTGVKKKVRVVTFGCQMNAHDSDKIEGMFIKMGYELTPSEKDADVILYNTCCVRESAENRVFGNLGYLKVLKEKKPDLKIIVCGCMVQQDTAIQKIKKSYRHVNIIVGTFNLHMLPRHLYYSLINSGQIIDIWKEHGEVSDDLPVTRHFKYKASVNIMYGCDNFCSYCIVPYVRGRERSRPEEEILNEVKMLAEDGVKEILLLGQNVNSYGGAGKDAFAALLRNINDIPGIRRIRFMTSHPKDMSDSLIYAVRDCENVCKQIHLPIQSGSTNILMKMNRKYTKDDYLRLTDKIKSTIPNVFITTDIITGFPGETDEDFNHTLDVIKKVRFAGAFTFIYSKRVGTPAAELEHHVASKVIEERFKMLTDSVNSVILEINREQVGKTLSVIPEEINMNDPSILTGRADNNSIVHFKGNKKLLGEITNVKITGCKTFYLIGECADVGK